MFPRPSIYIPGSVTNSFSTFCVTQLSLRPYLPCSSVENDIAKHTMVYSSQKQQHEQHVTGASRTSLRSTIASPEARHATTLLGQEEVTLAETSLTCACMRACMCACMCVHTCTHVCMHVCMHMCTCKCICACICASMCAHVCTCALL